MTGTEEVFLKSETVVSINENSQNGLEILQLSWKTPAPPCQCRDIMAQISIDTLNREGVIFVVDIENLLSRKDYIQIPIVSICAIMFRLRSRVDHPLDRLG